MSQGYVGLVAIVAGIVLAYVLHSTLNSDTQSALEAAVKIPIHLLWIGASIVTAVTIAPVFGALGIALWGMFLMNNTSRVNDQWDIRARVSSWRPKDQRR